MKEGLGTWLAQEGVTGPAGPGSLLGGEWGGVPVVKPAGSPGTQGLRIPGETGVCLGLQVVGSIGHLPWVGGRW